MILTDRDVAPGTQVFLNQRKSRYLRIGDLVLSFAKPTGEIPDGLTRLEQVSLNSAIRTGVITLAPSTPPESAAVDKRQKQIAELCALMDAAVSPKIFSVKHLAPALGKLVRDTIDGMTKVELLRMLISHEIQGLERPDFLEALNAMVEGVAGAGAIREEPLQEVKVQRPKTERKVSPPVSEI